MKKIVLYGDLRKLFGKEFNFDVATPAEAVRALCSQVKGFRTYLHEHAQDSFKIFSGGRNVSEDFSNPTSDKEVIRLAPVVQGANATAKIILGIALIALAWWNPMSWAASGALMSQATLYGIGASMTLGGVAELLSPQQKINSGSGESIENAPSYNFNGPVNTMAQGHPVPLAYGRIMAGSAVISAGLTTS